MDNNEQVGRSLEQQIFAEIMFIIDFLKYGKDVGILTGVTDPDDALKAVEKYVRKAHQPGE
jgi:hypothetical protein